jgi:hypothetical protein
MQLPPLTFSDLSLMIAVLAIVFLAVAELAPSSYGRTNLLINKKRLRKTAIVMGALFLITVGIRIIGMIFGIIS